MKGSTKKGKAKVKKSEIDISQVTSDVPSPIPSPFVGPLRKGSRRKQRREERTMDDEEFLLEPQGGRKRSHSLDLPLVDTSFGGLSYPDTNGATSNGDTRSLAGILTHASLNNLTEPGDDVETGHGVTFQIPPGAWLAPNESTPLLDTMSMDHYFNDNDDEESGDSSNDAQRTATDDDIQTNAFSTAISLFETVEETAQFALQYVEDAVQEAYADFEESRHYDWREFWQGGNLLAFARWLVTGVSKEMHQSDDVIQENLSSLARLLTLLREYEERYGMPSKGGPRDQEYVLREVTKDLYAGGCPIWALEPVMKSIAEGLTGQRGVEFFMLPRRAFIFAPTSGATSMFPFQRGYDVRKLDDMEAVSVRLASFASNTSSTMSIPSRWPNPQELRRASVSESVSEVDLTQEELTEEILNLASEAEGLFFYINSNHEKAVTRDDKARGNTGMRQDDLGDFWKVEGSTHELFSRLACSEAMKNIDSIDAERKNLYSPNTIAFFRVGAAACASAFWFNGSWFDVLVSGAMAIVIAWVGSSPLLSSQERILFEAVASLIVGMVAGLVSLTWPESTCFGAMAISGVLDLLQGFRVVYSIVEIMSRHTVTGGANLLEGIFFTTLIAYFLRFGQMAAIQILGQPKSDAFSVCSNGVNELWYILLVPLAAFCWSGLFNPYKRDLPLMTFHGVIGYVVSWQFRATTTTQLNNFFAATLVTFSAGVISRFTGRQALGNTMAGIYVLLPGAYLVDEVFNSHVEGFLMTICLRAIIIGVGAWTGTVLCSPTLLGTNRGGLRADVAPTLGAPVLTGPSGIQQNASVDHFMMVPESSLRDRRGRRRRRRQNVNGKQGSMLFF